MNTIEENMLNKILNKYYGGDHKYYYFYIWLMINDI